MVFEEFNPRIRVIFTADNFGRSRGTNRAILRAHREGVLTTASLAVKTGAFDEAVALAKETPSLGVGLQIVLVDGKSVLKPSEIVGLSDERFDFSSNLYGSALRYWITPRLHDAIRAEMDAQVRRYRMTGLPMGHLCGRNGFHLHPTAFTQIKQHYRDWGITAVRLTHDPVLTNLRVAFFATVRRTFRALLFRWFAEQARPALLRRGLRSPDRVFGSMVGGRFDEDYLVRILDELHAGTFEITCQPDEEDNLSALEALLSPQVKEVIRERGIEVIRYADL